MLEPGGLSRRALALGEAYWDDAVGLVRRLPDPLRPDPSQAGADSPPDHDVRSSLWYAVALLSHGGAGRMERATRVLARVLDEQFAAPGEPWDATWRRYTTDPDPRPGAWEWGDYDPNWREFVATTLLVARRRFGSALGRTLPAGVDAAVRRAPAATLRRDVDPRYSNIALLRAFLVAEVDPDRGVALARAVHERFVEDGCLAEYNSPTYAGISLYALALWRGHATDGRLRRWGAEMEAELWREVSAHYHPELGNLAGPYDRAYGMDMRAHVALTGLAVAAVADPPVSPVPATDAASIAHPWDLFAAPMLDLADLRAPDDAVASLRGPVRPGRHRRRLGPREISWWLGPQLAVGADAGTRQPPTGLYFHPVTVHWRTPSGGVGWLRSVPGTDLDARVDDGGALEVAAPGGTVPCELSAEGIDGQQLRPGRWELPGLAITVDGEVVQAPVGSAGASRVRIALRAADGPARVRLTCRLAGSR